MTPERSFTQIYYQLFLKLVSLAKGDTSQFKKIYYVNLQESGRETWKKKKKKKSTSKILAFLSGRKHWPAASLGNTPLTDHPKLCGLLISKPIKYFSLLIIMPDFLARVNACLVRKHLV